MEYVEYGMEKNVFFIQDGGRFYLFLIILVIQCVIIIGLTGRYPIEFY